MKSKISYPNVGDVFYWENEDGEVFEETCLKIEQEDNPDLETMYFTYVSENGGGVFVNEGSIIDSNSNKVKEFKKRKAEKKIEELIGLFNDEAFHVMIYSALRKSFDEDTTSEILETLSNKENYN